MIDHGTFERYHPTVEEQPVLAVLPKALFDRRVSDGADWYELQPTLDPDSVKVFLSGETIVSASRDATALGSPAGFRLVEIDLPEGEQLEGLLRKRLLNGKVTLPELTEQDVRAESARRLILLFGARDRAHLERLIADGTREAVKLLRIKEVNWTPEQQQRAAYLEASEAIVDAHDEASKALRALDPIPDDYADDRHWPAPPAAPY